MRNVCILTPRQAHQLEMHGTIPVCRTHHHISRHKAEELLADHVRVLNDHGDYEVIAQARWIGKGRRWIAFERARDWRKVPSANFAVMQLVPAGGGW